MDGIPANECISLKLGGKSFRPQYSYAIFGDEEEIKGYEDLEILLQWDPITLKPYFAFNPTPATRPADSQAPDARELLLSYLPENIICDDHKAYTETVKANLDSGNDVLSGNTIWTDGNYEVVLPEFADAMNLMKQIQIMVLFFIEGGSYIDETDDRWKIFFLRDVNTRAILGFCTVYPYLYYQKGELYENSFRDQTLNLERNRISQFLIFPPYQRVGHGLRLYKAIMSHLHKDDFIREITVEEPSEEFEIVRDRGDLEQLLADEQFPKDFTEILSKEQRHKLAQHFKLTERQLLRCCELAALKTATKVTPEVRRYIKARLWEQNYESLADLDKIGQQALLSMTCDNVLKGYKQVLRMAKPKSRKKHKASKESP